MTIEQKREREVDEQPKPESFIIGSGQQGAYLMACWSEKKSMACRRFIEAFVWKRSDRKVEAKGFCGLQRLTEDLIEHAAGFINGVAYDSNPYCSAPLVDNPIELIGKEAWWSGFRKLEPQASPLLTRASSRDKAGIYCGILREFIEVDILSEERRFRSRECDASRFK